MITSQQVKFVTLIEAHLNISLPIDIAEDLLQYPEAALEETQEYLYNLPCLAFQLILDVG